MANHYIPCLAQKTLTQNYWKLSLATLAWCNIFMKYYSHIDERQKSASMLGLRSLHEFAVHCVALVVENYNSRNSFVRRSGGAVVCLAKLLSNSAIDVHCFGDESVHTEHWSTYVLHANMHITKWFSSIIIIFNKFRFLLLLSLLSSSIYFHATFRGRCTQIAFAQYFKCPCLLMAFTRLTFDGLRWTLAWISLT